MKLPVFRPASGAMLRLSGVSVVLLVVVCFGLAGFVSAQTSQPSPSSSRASKKSSKNHAEPTATPEPGATPEGEPMSKEIPIPLPIGDSAFGLKVPNLGAAGQTLSQLMSMKAKRIDADHLELQGTKIDLNQADGKSDYHIEIPTSIFDLKTKVISSDHPVVIHTQDFDLTGESMRFDTVEKSGEFIGKVHMVIHNLKKSAGIVGATDTTKPE